RGRSARPLARRVPARRAFSSARTASWTRCGLSSTPKTDASSETSLACLPAPSSRGALMVVAGMALLLSDLDDAVLRAGYRSLDQQQVHLGGDGVHVQAHLGDAAAAEAGRHPAAPEDARRGRPRAPRAPP